MKTARELIIGTMVGGGPHTRLHDMAAKVADEILAKHVTEILNTMDTYDPVIESDQFSHQEDAYWAGFSAAIRILKGEMDESE